MKKFLAMALVCLMVLPAAACAQAMDNTAIAKEVVEQLFAGEFEKVYGRFTPEMQAAVPMEALEAMPGQMELACGAYEGIGAVEDITIAVMLQVNMAQIPLVAQVSIDGNGLVQGLGFQPAQQDTADHSLAENEEAVAVGPYALEGVLTIPEGEKLPGVVLVHGSGPNDRNETVGNAAIFRDLAEGLSAQGIAVLRYDKRAYAMNKGAISYTAEDIANMTVYEDTIEDALAAVTLLKADPRIDPERVYIIGHSQGAMLAGRIQEEANASGLVLMAGTMRSLATLLADQLEAMNSDSLTADIELARKIKDMTKEEVEGLTLLGSPAYFMWEEAQHDLKAVYDACDVPMLIIQGEDDVQVYADRDYALWEAFAQEHPDKDVELRLYEGLGHLLTVEDKLSPAVLEDIGAWILAH